MESVSWAAGVGQAAMLTGGCQEGRAAGSGLPSRGRNGSGRRGVELSAVLQAVVAAAAAEALACWADDDTFRADGAAVARGRANVRLVSSATFRRWPTASRRRSTRRCAKSSRGPIWSSPIARVPVVERPAFPVATRLGTRHAMTPAFLDGVIDAAGIQPGEAGAVAGEQSMLDQGVAGFEETVSALAARGIRTIGTAADGLVRRIEAGPLSVGLVAFTQWRNSAAKEFAGRVTMLGDIEGWRMQAPKVDLLCALPHTDDETVKLIPYGSPVTGVGHSAKNLMSPTLADEMRYQSWPTPSVVGIS